MDKTSKVLIALLRMNLDKSFVLDSSVFSDVDWEAVMSLAVEHGVQGLTFSGIEALSQECRPPMMVVMQWYGHANRLEQLYEKHKLLIGKLASLYASEGIRMMLLKGYGLSHDWPQPARRPVGDIDIYNFGEWERADRLVAERLGVEIESGHEHHTTFGYKGVMVENHYDFINVKAHRDAPAIEARLKSLASASTVPDPDIPNLCYPSADFNAVFLLRHMGQHFAGERVTLRQLLDWAFFMQKHGAEVDWSEILPYIESMGIARFFHQVNAICLDYLGFDDSAFPPIDRDSVLEKRIFEDILSPEFDDGKPSALAGVLLFKLRRWWANRWKHQLIYNEKLLPMFLTLLGSKLRRIGSIKD